MPAYRAYQIKIENFSEMFSYKFCNYNKKSLKLKMANEWLMGVIYVLKITCTTKNTRAVLIVGKLIQVSEGFMKS